MKFKSQSKDQKSSYQEKHDIYLNFTTLVQLSCFRGIRVTKKDKKNKLGKLGASYKQALVSRDNDGKKCLNTLQSICEAVHNQECSISAFLEFFASIYKVVIFTIIVGTRLQFFEVLKFS